jgi:hypothetical protein
MAHAPCLRHTDRLPAAGSAGGRVPGWRAGIKELNGLHKAADRVLVAVCAANRGLLWGWKQRCCVSGHPWALCEVRRACGRAWVAAKAAVTQE